MTRIEVLKTYKMYIGGKFPRTESGRYFTLKNTKGEEVANMCKGSRKVKEGSARQTSRTTPEN